MYSLDINFLKERPDTSTPVAASGGVVIPSEAGSQNWIVAIGLGAATAIVAFFLYFQFQSSFTRQLRILQAEQTRLNTELNTANAELTRLQSLNQELQTIRVQTEGFRSFLGSVQPWSAIFEELRRRIPGQGVWLTGVSASADTLSIQGGAMDFSLVNDFLLTLLDSDFFTSAAIKSSERVDGTETTEPSVKYELTVTVRTLGDPDPEFTRELEQRGSVGLVEKIRILRQVEAN